jgi:hypothetical protein
LESLYCQKNKLTALDISSNTQLIYLNCDDNPKLTCIKIALGQDGKLNKDKIPTTAKFSTTCD